MTATRPRILKGTAPLPGRRIPAAVHDADRSVREMLSAADAEASRMRAEAEASCHELRTRALEEGRRQGMANAAAALALAGNERDRLLARAEHEVAALAVSVARKVLGRELAAEEAVAGLAARAVAEARERREVSLRVNPADAPAVRAAHGSLSELLVRAALAIREDPAVPPGGVVVETESGRLDASIEAQLAELEAALAKALAP